jgi:hypothetical protein
MRNLRSTLVRGIIAVSLLWQVLGHPGMPRTLQDTCEGKLLLVNRVGHTVAVAPTCENEN